MNFVKEEKIYTNFHKFIFIFIDLDKLLLFYINFINIQNNFIIFFDFKFGKKHQENCNLFNAFIKQIERR